MKVIRFPVNPFSMNSYIYYDVDSKEGVIFDPAVFYPEEKETLKELIEKDKINITHIINTHGHIDHVLGNKFAKDLFGVPIFMHADDKFLLDNVKKQAEMMGIDIEDQPEIDQIITEDTIIKVGDTKLRFIHTPGHSPGSVSAIDDKNKNVFSGDIIFKNSIGRTDLQGGDMDTLLSSIKDKLFKECTDEYSLFPGHMEITNIADEKRTNPFLQ
jgi:glyoxylase-like metal-dependent hydrolase (beta-lactamase superfamily II)